MCTGDTGLGHVESGDGLQYAATHLYAAAQPRLSLVAAGSAVLLIHALGQGVRVKHQTGDALDDQLDRQPDVLRCSACLSARDLALGGVRLTIVLHVGVLFLGCPHARIRRSLHRSPVPEQQRSQRSATGRAS
nr:hypothetical protein [uncultured Friedmanniella sp.]